MKVSSSSKKELTTKVRKLEEKLELAKGEISELKRQNRKERRKTKLARASRDAWKTKTRKKASKIKGLEKKLSNQEKPKGHHYEVNLIGLCVLLRIVGGCSYRSIPRILKVLQLCFEVPWGKIPCANSVENWVSKMGLNYLNQAVAKVQSKSKEVCLIIDENLRIGNERMLLFLITPCYKEKAKALSYEDVQVVYLCGKRSWTGEKIKKKVLKLVEEKGMKVKMILSDEDSKLLKSARLLEYPHVPDIGHAVGKCLEKVFKKDEGFKSVTKLIGQFQSKSVHQDLSYLRPPKQRVKARFMNLQPFVKWAIIIITSFDELNEKERLFFKQIKEHQPILYTLKYCMELGEEILTSLKAKGLNRSTLENFKLKLADSKQKNKREKWLPEIVSQFTSELENYVNKYTTFLEKEKGEENYPVSSDVIESIFGKHKNMVSTNALVGMTILDLELPVHCQNVNDILDNIQDGLEEISMINLFDWRKKHSSENQALKRKLFFKKRA